MVVVRDRRAPERPSSGRVRRRHAEQTEVVQVRALKEFIQSHAMDDPFDLYYAGGSSGVPGTKWIVRQPPYSFNSLMRLPYENSILLQCIRAIVTNCDGHGWQLEYVGPKGDHDSKASVAEHAILMDLLQHPHHELTSQQLRERIREDMWTVGNAFIEVARGQDGRIVMVSHIPAYMMRVTGPDREYTASVVSMPRDGNPSAKATIRKRYHRFVQMYGVERVFFKEFGDPRPINPKNGMVTPGLSDGEQATEIIHLSFYTPFSVYGIPPWVANMPSVLGSRQAELVNLDFFSENAVPAMALLVSGGQLTNETVEEVDDHFTSVRGRGSMHRILVMEALGDAQASGETGTVPTPKLELKALQGERQSDQLFQEYDKNARGRIRSSFRLPPVLLGEASDYTYASSKVSFEIAESQVFGPERQKMDDMWNHKILATYQPKFWRMRSNQPRMVDPEDVIKAIDAFDRVGALTPNVAIHLYNEYFDTRLDAITDPWGDVPMALLVEFATNSTLVGFEDVYDPELAKPEPTVEKPNDNSEKTGKQSKKDDQTVQALLAMRRAVREFRSATKKMDRSDDRAR